MAPGKSDHVLTEEVKTKLLTRIKEALEKEQSPDQLEVLSRTFERARQKT
jgi:hypothetical protein